MKSQGARVGKMTLFFGGRYSKNEYYYREELEAYEAEGLVQCCNAWSRDTSEKVYVQDRIQEKSSEIWQQLGAWGSTGYFFLCGSKQPEKDVYATLLGIMKIEGGMTVEQAEMHLEQLKADGRYVTEVY
jgi:sulfite reductase (NADPH) flavoprotein alpha-component